MPCWLTGCTPPLRRSSPRGQRGTDLVLRLSAHNRPLSDQTGQRLDLARTLRQHPKQRLHTLAVRIEHPTGLEEVAAWVHAVRLDERAAKQARRRARHRAQKNGQTVKAQTLFFADWLLVVTPLPPEQFSAETILALHQLR